jgi:hypothetical protein
MLAWLKNMQIAGAKNPPYKAITRQMEFPQQLLGTLHYHYIVLPHWW